MNLFSHLDENGQASMVDIGAKDITRRFAVASGSIAMSGECFSLLIDGRMPKGDVFSTARIAGIQAALKRQDGCRDGGSYRSFRRTSYGLRHV